MSGSRFKIILHNSQVDLMIIPGSRRTSAAVESSLTALQSIWDNPHFRAVKPQFSA